MEAQRTVIPRGEQAPELVARRPHTHDELVRVRFRVRVRIRFRVRVRPHAHDELVAPGR